MDFKDYYKTLGVEKNAPAEDIKRAYRKLARKFHPDVSTEPDAEARFKEVAEAHEALSDPERRAAYDDLVLQRAQEAAFGRTASGGAGYEFGGRGAGNGARAGFGHRGEEDFSDFFENLFGQQQAARGQARGFSAQGASRDHHARIEIDLADAFSGARRTISLRRPVVNADGSVQMREHQLEVNIPKGIRPGQHLRLNGQGEPAQGQSTAGDLFLEVSFRPDSRFRIDGADLWTDLPVAPWEAALGATVPVLTPEGEVQLTIPPGSAARRKLRLKGKGLPGTTAGDLYVQLELIQPPLNTDAQREAWAALGRAFPGFDPRTQQQG